MNLNSREIIHTFSGIDWGLEAIKAPNIWDKTKGEGVKILLMDTGIHSEHEDLKDSFKGGYNYIEGNRNVEDYEGHGSAVAGLIVGKKTGVAPMAELEVIKVLSDNAIGTYKSVTEGLTHAIYYKHDIVCMSLGINGELPLFMRQKIVDAYSKGITIVSAVGNSGGGIAFNPARMKEVIAVGGLDKSMNKTDFTNRGYDVLAPAVDITSTYLDGKYVRMSGTSMSAPLVAGGIALLISHYRNQGKELSQIEIKEMIKGKLDLTTLIV